MSSLLSDKLLKAYAVYVVTELDTGYQLNALLNGLIIPLLLQNTQQKVVNVRTDQSRDERTKNGPCRFYRTYLGQ